MARVELRQAMVALLATYWQEPENAAGGTLHAVIDDGNFDDASIESAAKYADEQGDFRAVAVAAFMLSLSREDRERFVDEVGRFDVFDGSALA